MGSGRANTDDEAAVGPKRSAAFRDAARNVKGTPKTDGADRVSGALWPLLSAALHDSSPVGVPALHAEDWDELIALSQSCCVTGLLFPAVAGLPQDRRPPRDRLERWRKMAMQTGIRESQRFQAAAAVAGALGAQGIRAVGLKGVVVRALYPHPELRTMGDVDLLIRPEDLAPACDILQGLGMRKVGATENVQSWWHESGTMFELHHRLFITLSRIQGETGLTQLILDRSQPDPTSGLVAPSIEDSAVYLVLHMVKHLRATGFGPRDLADLTVLLKAGVDAGRLAARLEEHRAGRFGRSALLLCRRKLQAPLPADLESAWSGEIRQELLDMLARDILDAGVHGGRRPDRGLAFAAVMQGKYRDRTHASPRLESGAAEGSRARMLSRMAFPVRGHLGERYKYAWSNPLLLPVAWAHRIARGLIVPPAVLWRRLQTVRSAERMSGEKLRLLTDLQVLDY